MKKEELFNIIGEVDEQKVAVAGMAMNTKKKSRPVWVKWGAMAACLCLVVVGALTIPNWQNEPQGSSDFTAPYYSLSETEHLCVEVIEVGAYTYKAKVVDTGNNSIYALGTELGVNVNFGYTEILMSDGTFFNDGVDDTSLRLENIGWDVGSILYVEFEAYTETNKHSNLLFASYIRQANGECLELPDIEATE